MNMMTMLLKSVQMEDVRRKLEQLWKMIREWRFMDIIHWTFSWLHRLLKVLRSRLSTARLLQQTTLFPITRDTNVPNPSSLWSPVLKERLPLPTNTSWLNFVLNEGTMPEYMHPYVISCKQGLLSICFPSQHIEEHAITQVFVPDITVGSTPDHDSSSIPQHIITSFDDVSVTLQLPGGIMVPLVRGCPYITFIFNTLVLPSFATTHNAIKLISNDTHTKHLLFLDNSHTWIIYSSHELFLVLDSGLIRVERMYKGHVRIVLLQGGAEAETVLDEYAATYPLGGSVTLSVPFLVSYTWEKVGPADKSLLMLSLPVHRDLMAHVVSMDNNKGSITLHPSVTYDGIDGRMEAIAGDAWVLKTSSISNVAWYSIHGIQNETNKREIRTLLRRDMSDLMPLPANIVSAYSHGKFMARVAQMAMIAEEVGSCLDVVRQAREFLKGSLTAWLNGSFKGNALVYDAKWGGIVEFRTSVDATEGAYNDAHYTLSYFCYAGAVLAKLDGAWGEAHRTHLYTLLGDYMSGAYGVKSKSQSNYVFPRLRYFDMWVLHSWGGDGLVLNEYGRRQLSSSEAVHAYYAGAMLGEVFEDSDLINLGRTLASLEIKAAQTVWHIPASSTVYPPSFVSSNRMIRVLWANKRECLAILHTQSTAGADGGGDEQTTRPALPSASITYMDSEMKDKDLLCPHHLVSMQVLPIVPISEVLFSNTEFARELVDWASPSLSDPHTDDYGKTYIYALEALYEHGTGLIKKALALSYPNGEFSRSILIWWIYSRKTEANES